MSNGSSLSRFRRFLSFYEKSFNLLSTIRFNSTTKKFIASKQCIDYKSNINTQEQLSLNLTSLTHFYNKMIIKYDNYVCNKVPHIDVLNSNLLDRVRVIFDDTIMKLEQTTDFLTRLIVIDDYQQSVLTKTYLLTNQKQNLIAGSKLMFNTYSSLNKYQPIKTSQVNRKKELDNKVNTKKSLNETMQDQAQDKSQPRPKNIDTKLDCLALELGNYGLEVDASCINSSIEEKYVSDISDKSGHSERLALAFNFLHRPNATFIQITNNIRICPDCHHFMKLIAKVRKCEIVIRDPNRIHRFTPDGNCSCKDHF